MKSSKCSAPYVNPVTTWGSPMVVLEVTTSFSSPEERASRWILKSPKVISQSVLNPQCSQFFVSSDPLCFLPSYPILVFVSILPFSSTFSLNLLFPFILVLHLKEIGLNFPAHLNEARQAFLFSLFACLSVYCFSAVCFSSI